MRRAGSAYLIVAIGALFMLAPFWFMFVFATHTRSEIFNLPPPVWFGDASRRQLQAADRATAVLAQPGLELYVAAMATVLTLLFCSMAGYAFAMMSSASRRRCSRW